MITIHYSFTKTIMTSSSDTNTAVLAPLSSRTSLKRSRILFDTSATNNTNDNEGPPSLLSDPSTAATMAFVPPLFDSKIHKAAVHRKMKLFYPDDANNLAYNQVDDNEEGSKKESATGRAVKELRREAFDRVRSGEAVGDGDTEGRLIIHRESDLKQKVDDSGRFDNEGTSLTVIPKTKTEDTTKQPVRSSGILVKQRSDESSTSIPTPAWHAPWRLSTVISSHLGWVRSVAFDPTNAMFATGGGDRVIKIFDLAKACAAAEDALKITLTGHISPVRGLAFSERHPYLFSAGEDKMVKVRTYSTLL